MSEPASPDPNLSRPLRVISLLHLVAAIIATGLMISGISGWVAIPACFLPVHLGIIWATLSPYCQWIGPVVTGFTPAEGKKELWLTIDDGPAPEETPAVLDVLDRFGARATFFVIGEKATAHPELIQEIHHRGHQIGNHTHHHRQYAFWWLPKKPLRDEIDGGANAIRSALPDETGYISRSPLFRAPVGMKPFSLHRLLVQRGLRLIAWTVRGRDGVKKPNLDRVFKRLQSRARPGAILLMHEGRGHAPELLERLLPALEKEGYEFVIPSLESFVNGRR